MISTRNFKVCLVNPPVIAVLEPWYDIPDFGRTALAYLAGYLRQFEGFEIKIIDAKFERLNFEQTLEEIKTFQPDIVGLTAFTNEIKPAAYMAHIVKENIKNCCTVVGGAHITAIPKETMQEFPMIDYGVEGEGEETFMELCTALKSRKDYNDEIDFHSINGLLFRENGDIIQNKPRERILDQDSIPFPAWDLLPKADAYFVQSMRGCPFNCLFCMNPNGRIARKRSVENVMEELRWIVDEFKPKRISFGDELFSVDIPRTHQLLQAMAKEGIGKKVSWDVQTHVHYVNKELFEDFKKANVEIVEVGIETGDEEMLRKMGKGTNLKLIESACKAGKEAGVKIGSFFLFGQPNENKESLEKTVNLAVKINPDLPMFGLMTPYPGTEVARMAAKQENGYKLLSTDWDEYNKQIGGAMEFANLSRAQIEWFQIKAYTKVYLYNKRFTDFVKFVWDYKEAAWEVLKKMLLRRKSIVKHHKKPSDYDSVLNVENSRKANINDFVTSRENWNKTQQREMKRAKKASPELHKSIRKKKDDKQKESSGLKSA
ncbi:MAG: radical SAM protein [Chitinophagales bacterium]